MNQGQEPSGSECWQLSEASIYKRLGESNFRFPDLEYSRTVNQLTVMTWDGFAVVMGLEMVTMMQVYVPVVDH
jgi:hypothetical protein